MTSSIHSKVDMVINQGSNVLQVLSDNTITFIALSGKVPEVLWTYNSNNGNEDLVKSQLKADYIPVIIELLVPTSGTNIENNIPVALGCFVKSSSTNTSNTYCDKVFILNTDINKKKASFSSLMLGFQQVNLDSIHALVATNVNSFSNEDIIFGKSSDTQVTILSLSTNKPVTIDLPMTSPSLPEDKQYITDYNKPQSKVSNKFIITTSNGDLLPFVTSCSSDNSVFKCDAFAIVMKAKPSIFNAAQCIGRTSAVIGFERHLVHSHVAKSIACIAVDSTLTSSTMVISNVKLDNSEEPTISSNKIVLPNIAISSLQYVTAMRGHNLIVESSGRTFMTLSDKIIWTRDEALSNIRQVLIIDGHNSIINDENSFEIVNFWTRLQLQKVELIEAFVTRIESMKQLPMQLIEQFIPNYKKLLQFDFEMKKKTPKEIIAEKKLNREKKRESQRKGAGRTSKAIHFGFDKIALCLTSNYPLEGSNVIDANIRVSAVDLIRGEVIWSVEPLKLPSEKISIARLLKVGKSNDNFLLLSTDLGNIYFYKIDLPIHDGLVTPHKIISMTSKESNVNPLVSIFTLDRDSNRYLLLHKPDLISNLATVTIFPAPKESSSTVIIGKYIHYFDKSTGIFQTFTIDSKIDTTTYSCKPLASLAFSPEIEQVLSVTYPTLIDTIDKRFTVLGDDSILLKYLNPHIALIITETKIMTEEKSSNQTSILYATVIDTVSAKIIYRLEHDSGSGPVHAVFVENSIVYTYWNSLAKRTELSSIALYEGMVDRFGLNPVAYLKATGAIQQLQKDARVSAFSTPPPIGIQKTYVLPKSVSAIHHTITSNGIANKNILIAFKNGQIYSLDMRMLHPRRPFGEPSKTEKEEGLIQYNPFIHLAPAWAMTLGNHY